MNTNQQTGCTDSGQASSGGCAATPGEGNATSSAAASGKGEVGSFVEAFTPGPWDLGCGYGNSGVQVVGDAGNRLVCGVIGVSRDTSTKDGRFAGTEQLAEGWANARLIAAAPDLLAALQELRYACTDKAERMADAAIRKAVQP